MLNEILVELYERDLNKLRDEIEAFPSEESLWKVEDGIANSAGNLCQHLTGNLQHFSALCSAIRAMSVIATRSLPPKEKPVPIS